MEGLQQKGRRGWRHPLLHFLLLGTGLFAIERWTASDPMGEVVITAGRIEQLAADWQLDFGAPPTAQEQEVLIDREISDELLLTHALELGLQYEDPAAQRLAELAAFLGEPGPKGADRTEVVRRAVQLGLHRRDPKARQELLDSAVARITAADVDVGSGELPPEGELASLLHRDPDRYREPERLRLTQVLSAGQGPEALAEAHRRRRQLLSRGSRDAAELSDPGPLPVDLESLSRRQLRLRLGEAAAEATDHLEPGQWSDPVAVEGGFRLLWLHERIGERPPEVEEIKDRLRADWLNLRREARLAMALEDLRQRFRVRIEGKGASAKDIGARSSKIQPGEVPPP